MCCDNAERITFEQLLLLDLHKKIPQKIIFGLKARCNTCGYESKLANFKFDQDGHYLMCPKCKNNHVIFTDKAKSLLVAYSL